MAEKIITMETDWGAKGAQLTGAEVQKFIKDQLSSLQENDTNIQEQRDALNDSITQINSQIRATTDGCFIVYHQGYVPKAVPFWEWPALQSEGKVADGVMVCVDGQVPLIVAPEEATNKNWSLNSVLVTEAITDYDQAYTDFSGKDRTADIMAMGADLFGENEENWTQYAPAWCNAYSRAYPASNMSSIMFGIGAGRWWLPSTSELITIYKHRAAINLCLSVISGADPIGGYGHWSSTQYSAGKIWALSMDGSGQGIFDGCLISAGCNTRPVTHIY